MTGDSDTEKRPINPLLWPWQDSNRTNLALKPLLMSRKFTVIFLTSNWLFVWILGYGSTWDCDVTWQKELMCESAIYANEIFAKPNEFILSWFTGVWFNNGLDHIFYVTCGLLIFVQSYEQRMGTKNTLFLFFSGTAVVSSICAIVINYGHFAYPENEVFITGMGRNWMGGSVGMFAILGALLHCSRRPVALFIPVFIFEIWNGQTNITILTSSAHMLSLLYGYAVGFYIQKKTDNSTL